MVDENLLEDLKESMKNIGTDNNEAQILIEQFLKSLSQSPDINDEDKANIVENFLGGNSPLGKSPLDVPETVSNYLGEYAILAGFISIIVLIFGFILFKLYDNAAKRAQQKELKKLKKEQKKLDKIQ